MDDYDTCLLLQEAIALGKIEDAKKQAILLARKKSSVSFFPVRVPQGQQTAIHKTVKSVLCNVHNQRGEKKTVVVYVSFFTKVSELKSRVSYSFQTSTVINFSFFLNKVRVSIRNFTKDTILDFRRCDCR